MKTISKILTVVLLLMITGCIKNDTYVVPEEIDQAQAALTVDVRSLSDQQLTVQNYVKERPIIAHRGTTNYAPQGTAAAYRFARYVGADYLQIDLQMTSDGFLVAFKGDDLAGKSNVDELFPGYENAPVNHFTLAELKTLDIGSWFASTTYDRPGFQGLKILTLEEIINICEGKLEDGTPDPADTGNRPGIYIRMYDPWLNIGIEEKLKTELMRLGWYDENLDNLRPITTFPDKVAVANTKGRVFLATLQNASLLKLEEVFEGKLPLAQ
jgi:glycerophosphoryl diester phosphodiesterase